jgi:hypothetical protein
MVYTKFMQVYKRFKHGLHMVYTRFTHCLPNVYTKFMESLLRVCAGLCRVYAGGMLFYT